MNTLLHITRARWALPATSLLLLVAACAGPREYSRSETPYALPAEASTFFSETYRHVADKYVQPVEMADLAFNGIGNLRNLDPALTFSRQGRRIEVFHDSKSLGGFLTPARNDSDDWSGLTLAVIEKIREQSATLRDAKSETIYQNVAEGALKNLDRYSRYMIPEVTREVNASRKGFGGIGITLDTKDGKVRVASVMEETPAAAGGIQVDDLILNIDGQSTAGLPVRDIVGRLRGNVGATVNLTIARAGSPERDLNLRRALIVPPTVSYRRDGNIAIFRVTGFNQQTTPSLATAMRRAKREIGSDLAGAILDLRGNLGGYLDQAVSLSDLFLAEGRILTARGRHRSSGQSSSASRGDLWEEGPLVVLVNGASASASEIVAAALQDNGRAVLVGTTTFGKGSVQTVIPMPNGGEIDLTWARFHAPSGYPIADLGVTPAVCTSGDKPAGTHLAAVHDNRPGFAAHLAEWRATDHSNMVRMNELRAICNPESGERAVDLEVAKGLLSDKTLYAQALNSTILTARVR